MGLANTISQIYGTVVEGTDRGVPAFVKDSSGNYAVMKMDSSGNLLSSIAGGGVASGSTDSGNPVKVGGVYNSSAPTLTTGQRGDLQLDANANLKVTEQWMATAEDNPNAVIGVAVKPVSSSTYAATTTGSLGASVAISAKNAPGNLFCVMADNANAADRYLQVHNKASAPASSDVPVLSYKIPAGGMLVLDRGIFGEHGKYLSTGIAIGISTVRATFTAATVTDHYTYAEFV